MTLALLKSASVWSADPIWRGWHHYYPPSTALCWIGRPNRCDVGWYRSLCIAATSLPNDRDANANDYGISKQGKGNTWHQSNVGRASESVEEPATCPCYIRDTVIQWRVTWAIGKGTMKNIMKDDIWLISYRKCWCSTTENYWSSHLLRFGMLWHKGQNRHFPYKAACME